MIIKGRRIDTYDPLTEIEEGTYMLGVKQKDTGGVDTILVPPGLIPGRPTDPKLYEATVLTDQNGLPLEDQDGRYIVPEDVDIYARDLAEEALIAIEQMPKPFYPAGDWDAATDTPKLEVPNASKAGAVYRVSVAGTRFSLNWNVGDKLAYYTDGSIGKWDVTDEVTVADLDAKLDKVTNADRVYVTNGEGEQATYAISTAVVSWSVPIRSGPGRLKAADAVDVDDVVTKSQLDAAIQAAIQNTWNGEY